MKHPKERESPRHLWLSLFFAALIVAALVSAWRYSRLSELISPQHITEWAEAVRGNPWAPVMFICAYIAATFLMLPAWAFVLFGVVAFGPWLGFAYAMLGIMLAGAVAYHVGRVLSPHALKRLAGARSGRIAKLLHKHGVAAVFTLRMLPTAPYGVESMICGAVGLRLLPYLLGTALGMAPGVLAATVFGHQIATALRDLSKVSYVTMGVTAALLVGVIYAVRRWSSRRKD